MALARPLTQSDLIFPTQALNFSSTLHSLKRSALSITNRLNSITADSNFALSVSQAYGLPLVANERCGSWYIPPEKKVESVYFKSTDGHMNEWSFNLRRLNYQVLDVVGEYGGCVIVDSTRRGKSMPDALSKTIPIWCCVMNRALFSESSSRELFTPPQAVSPSEHVQIEKRMDRFVRQFLDICRPNIPELRKKLQRPLRPIWVTQECDLPQSPPTFTDFHPVILCTASRRVYGGEISEGGYIQGAADDHEAWACGLTPKLFWANKDQLLSTNEEDLPALIAELIKAERGPDAKPILIKPTSNLYISSSQNLDISPFDVVISCTPEPLTTTNHEYLKSKKYLHLPLVTGKLGSRDLRTRLPRLLSFFSSLADEVGNILVCCPTGKDISVGVVLAILCLYTNDEGQIANTRTERKKIEKTFIKQRLTWITTTSPTLNPSRETLKSVNAFLMPDPSAPPPAHAPSTDETGSSSKLVLVDENGTPIPPKSSPHIPVTDLPLNDTQHPSTPSPPQPSPPPSQPHQLRIFTSLQPPSPSQPWSFTRTLTSNLPSHPSGTVLGTATFTPYPPPSSTPRSNSAIKPPSSTLLYSEMGEFITESGLRFTARRKYMYALHPRQDSSGAEGYISVHFFDDEKGEQGGIGGLFVEMDGLSRHTETGVFEAGNQERHLCGEDLYTVSWRFGAGMVEPVDMHGNEKWWEVRYDVKGPKKEYVSETRYTTA